MTFAEDRRNIIAVASGNSYAVLANVLFAKILSRDYVSVKIRAVVSRK